MTHPTRGSSPWDNTHSPGASGFMIDTESLGGLGVPSAVRILLCVPSPDLCILIRTLRLLRHAHHEQSARMLLEVERYTG